MASYTQAPPDHDGDEPDEDEPELHVEKVGLKPTTTDAAILSLAHYIKLGSQRDGMGQLVTKGTECDLVGGLVVNLALHFVTLAIQVTVVFFFFATTVEFMEDPYEPSQMQNLETALQGALSNGTLLTANSSKTSRDALGLCQKDHTFRLSHQVMLFLWFAKMVQELFDNFRRFRVVWLVPLDDENSCQDDDSHDILSMGPFAKFMSISFVVVPHVLCNLFVTWTGAKFLSLTNNMGSLILKAFGLSYIVLIEQNMFSAFTSVKFVKYLSSSSFVIASPTTSRNDKFHTAWDMWLSTIVKFAVTLLLAVLFYRLGFMPVLSFKNLCEQYFAAFPSQKCIGNGETCGLKVLGLVPWV